MTGEPLVTRVPDAPEAPQDEEAPATPSPPAEDGQPDAATAPPAGYLSPRRAFTMLAVALTLVLVALVGWLVFLLLKPSGLVVRGGQTRAGIEPVLTIVGPGRGPAPTFRQPMGAAFGVDGRIYVSDTGNNRVCVFDRDGAFLFEFGGFGVRKPLPGGRFTWRPGLLNYPIGIAVDRTDGDVYVADFRNDQVQRFSSEGSYTASFPDPTTPVGRGSSGQDGTGLAVTDVAVRGGRVYATDAFQVFVFGNDGRLLDQWGKPGMGPSDLDHPNGIAVAPDGVVYVSDSNHARVIAFSAEGRRIWAVGEVARAKEDTQAALGMPRGLAVTDVGEIIVADAFLFDLALIGPDGVMRQRFGERGEEPGRFNFPNDVDASGDRLVVADRRNNRVQVLKLVRRSQ